MIDKTRKFVILLYVFLFIVNINAKSQSPSSGCGSGGAGSGNDGGCQGCGGGQKVLNPDGIPIHIPTLHATDPNEIQGPNGITTKKWMAGRDKFGFTVRFENDPEFANGPAQKVLVSVPIDPKFNINSLRIGNFGFGNMFFDVPANSPTYYHRLDVRDSLGVYVDVLAGIDVTTHQALWVFESIDPATGAEPTNAALGFLPVRDTSINRFNDSIPNKGEGFVTFTIQPTTDAKTGDSVNAQASIIFDLNAPVLTNITGNTIDAASPTSIMNPAPVVTNNSVNLSWAGKDDNNGSGLKEYALYVSANGGAFALYKDKLTDTTLSFPATNGNKYCFFTLATDNVGNQEALKNSCEVTVNLSVTLPVSWLYFTGKKQGNDVQLNWATTREINAKQFVIERSTDGHNFSDIGNVSAVGNSSITNNYSFLDVNAMALNAPVLYYRLRQVDQDGKITYSIIVLIKSTQDNSEPLITAYPNPFGSYITLKIMNVTLTDKNNLVSLFTLDGKLLYQQEIVNQGSATILLDKLPPITPGMYLLKASINGKLYTIKMVHQ